jgi:hypothetical protein
MKSENQAAAGWAATHTDAIHAPPSNATPEGYQVHGVSTRVDRQGETDQQWIKTRLDSGEVFEVTPGHLVSGMSVMTDAQDRVRLKWQKIDVPAVERQSLQEAVLAALNERIVPTPPVEAPMYLDADLATLYTMTDCHVGMLAWDKETGADWDLDLAERCLVNTLLEMIAAAPASKVGILNQLGDFLHFDSLAPMTPTHGHVLDADSRYQKVVMVAVRILRRVIAAMLAKHEEVYVYMMEGNHDPAGSVWLRIMFAHLYENEPRVHVNLSPNPYAMYEHGKVMLGFYHGHLAKISDVDRVFSDQFREAWGRCPYVYIHTGHKHHVEEKEKCGAKVIQHPTLAAPDAYASRGGWLSKRQATSMTYHKVRGEVARGIFIPA